MHDIVNLEAQGIPGVYVATVEFEDGGLHQAKTLGADPASVFVEHPIQDRSDDEMLVIADKAFDEIYGKLILDD